MKIAWITYDFEEYSAHHVNAMASEHDVLLVMPKPDGLMPNYCLNPSIEHYSFEKPRLRQPFRQWKSIRQILERVERFQPDVVHFQQGHMWFNFALKSLRRYPLVITIHDPRHHAGDGASKKTPQWLIDYGFRKAHHVIVHGEALADQVHNLFGIPRSNIHVIPLIAIGGEIESSSELGEPGCVLFFGRIWDYKGLHYLIEAAPLVAKKIPHVKFVIAGEGDDFQKYRDLIGESPLFEVHNRWISDEERAEMFRRSSVVVLPYTEATQSAVVPVAYNFSRPVVGTRVGALAECIDDGTTGFLVPPRDPESLAVAIVQILENDSLRLKMGMAGKQKLNRECSPEVVAQSTLRVYSEAIAKPHFEVQ
jgi:glycosyltransferase involved in cell wall biosynthesis